MESQLKGSADRRHISLLMNGCQIPIMSRPHSGRTRVISNHQSRLPEQRVTANGSNSGKGNKDLKFVNDQKTLRTKGGTHGVREERVKLPDYAASEGHSYACFSKQDSQKNELATLLSCSTTLDGRIRSQGVCDQTNSSGNTKMRPHTAHTCNDKAKSSSWIDVKKDDEKVGNKASRITGSNRKVLHRSLSISSLPDRMNFGKVPSHRRNRVPMLNCYCLNGDLNSEVLPKIIDAALYAKSKADQRNSSVLDAAPTKKAEPIQKFNDRGTSTVDILVQVHQQLETQPKVTKVSSLLPLMGFRLGKNEAAIQIQKWYKRHSARRKAADAALRRMRSSPSVSRKGVSHIAKVCESSSVMKFDHAVVVDCARKERVSCDSNRNSLQRKKSSIALHIVPSDYDGTSYNGFQVSQHSISVEQGSLEGTIPKEQHVFNRRRKSDGDIPKHRSSLVSLPMRSADQHQRSLSDGAIKAELGNSLTKSNDSIHRPKTPEKTCSPSQLNKRCSSAPRAHRSRLQHLAVSKVKIGLPLGKGDFSNDSLECVQAGNYDSDDDNCVALVTSDQQHQKQVDSAFDIMRSRRPSEVEAVIVHPLPSEPTSDSALSSSNDGAKTLNGEKPSSELNHPYSRLQQAVSEENGHYFCNETNAESAVVEEDFSGSGNIYHNESIIPLQLRNIERLLLRSSSTEDGSASAQTAMTSVNSEACTVDSLDCCHQNLQSLIPVSTSPGKLKLPLHSTSLVDSSGNREKGLTVEQVEKLNNRSKHEHSDNIGILTESKLRDIMVFLDEIENTDDLSDVRSRATLPKPIISTRGRKVDATVSDAGGACRKYVANRVIGRDHFKGSSVKNLLSKRTVSSDSLESADEIQKKSVPVCSRNQVIERQLTFIDQLLEEKALLTEKYEQLLKGAKDSEKKFEQKLKHLKEQHAFDLKRYREWHAASEKVRREKWMAEQTKKIQDKTVQRMEPEFKRLLAHHQTDVKELKERHVLEMREADIHMQKKLDAEVESVQKAMAENIERAVTKEREAAQRRLEDRLAQERNRLEDKNSHLMEEITHLRNLLEIQEQQCHIKLEQARNTFEANRKKDVESLQSEYIRRHEDELLRHQSEAKKIKDKLHQEYELKEEALHKQHQEKLLAQEKVLREQYKKDRDQQIELVLRRLEDETTTSRQENDRAVEHRIRSLREKHHAEVQELESAQHATTARFQEMKIRLASIEEENLMLRETCKQKKLEVNELTKMITHLHKSKTSACEAIHRQYEEQLLKTTESVEGLQKKLVEMEEHYRSQNEKIQAEHNSTLAAKDKELDDVSRRVRLAISKKDDTIGKLKADYNAALTRADQYEKLLIKFKK